MSPQEPHLGQSPADGLVLDSERSSLLFGSSNPIALPSDSSQSYLHFVDVQSARRRWKTIVSLATITVVSIYGLYWFHKTTGDDIPMMHPTGPYKLVEAQQGHSFFNRYDFYTGADSIGSAGHQIYVSKQEAIEMGIIGVGKELSDIQAQKQATDSGNVRKIQEANAVVNADTIGDAKNKDDEEFVFMTSAPNSSDATLPGMRSSIRLEGRRRYNRGLFILDVRHMPVGCGVWPAFWLSDEDRWPENGEIDIVEGVNYQSKAKTALHTSDKCSMYAHVPNYEYTDGEWERATGIPDTFTGLPDYNTSLPADNCYAMAPHQWANQGCIMRHTSSQTIGIPINEQGGGVYVLEWDPANGYIKSWVFSDATTPVPDNLQQAIDTSSNPREAVMPDPSLWVDPGNPDIHLLPYAYFAIGEGSGCSSDHFRNMHIIFNTAFCGTVSGNRYPRDCPSQVKEFQVKRQDGSIDPVLSCNKWIASDPEELKESYWKIKGVYIYERQNVVG